MSHSVDLAAVRAAFEENFRHRGELGASVSIWQDGEEVLSLAAGRSDEAGGRPWTRETLIPVYSASKGPAAATLLAALDEHGLDSLTPVREVWPQFPVAEAQFAHLLSHQCGLAALDHPASVWNHAEVVAAIEAQTPAWLPGRGHGYHPRTFGALLDEPVRRLVGRPLGEFWHQHIAAPLGLEFWIGLPGTEYARVATLYPGKASPHDFQTGFYRAFQTAGSLTHRAFSSPQGLRSVREMNDPQAWAAGLPAMGGIGTARALARFYQMAAGLIPGPLSRRTRQALATRLTDGDDLVLLEPTAFSAGCQLDPLDPTGQKIRRLYGPSNAAFGHPGAGGSHAFADPENGLSFAYTMNQMELSVMPGIRTRSLIEALYPPSATTADTPAPLPAGMHPAYAEAHFHCPQLPASWPHEFAVISAWATTGEQWTAEQNAAADAALQAELATRHAWHHRLTGYSPATGHTEPGWAAALDFDSACNVGEKFHQDAIYYICNGELSVSFCDSRRRKIPLGPFLPRLRAGGFQALPESD